MIYYMPHICKYYIYYYVLLCFFIIFILYDKMENDGKTYENRMRSVFVLFHLISEKFLKHMMSS